MKNKTIQKKFLIFFLATALIATIVTGCASSSTSTSEQTTTDQSTSTEEVAVTEQAAEETASAEASDAVTVKVTAVDGDTITAVVGEMESSNDAVPPGDGDMQSMEEKPEGDAPSGNAPQGDAPSDEEKPEGSTEEMPENGDKDGAAPADMGAGFVEGDETISFTLTDDTEITSWNQQDTDEVTADSIVTDSILTVTLDDENNAISIVIK